MIITYVTDQYKKIVSGPGVFVNIIDHDTAKLGYIVKVISLETLANYHFKLQLLNKIKTFVIMVSYSLVTSYLSIVRRNDILLINSFYLIIFSINKSRYAVFVNDIKFMNSSLRLWLALLVLSRCKLIVANSHYVASQLRELGLSNIKVLKKCLAKEYCNRDFEVKVSTRKPSNNGVIRLIFVKTDWEIGGLRDVIISLSKVINRDFVIKIVGIPEQDVKNVEALCGATLKPGSYKVLGHLDQAALMQEYLHSDIFINNCRIEAFCVAAIEAAASGCLVVSVNHSNGLNQLMLEEGFGLILGSIADLSELVEGINMSDYDEINDEVCAKIRSRFHPNVVRRNLYTVLKSE